MLGRIRYNRLLKTGTIHSDWKDLNFDIDNDGMRRRTANGTVINVFSANYKQYIDIGVKDEIRDFVLKNKSSVCGTVWGHGGVGKKPPLSSTYAKELGRSSERSFDYIIFISAKDRSMIPHWSYLTNKRCY